MTKKNSYATNVQLGKSICGRGGEVNKCRTMSAFLNSSYRDISDNANFDLDKQSLDVDAQIPEISALVED